MELIEKLFLFSIVINFECLKMIRGMVSANYDFGFESWKILAEKMCHKSSWVCI